MSDDWLKQLQQLREADKIKQQVIAEKKRQKELEQKQTLELLQTSKAHELLRQVQKIFLGGQGMLDIFDKADGYERVVTLAWQGAVSEAKSPDPNNTDGYDYILVGVRQGKLWVNDKKLAGATPELLKVALIQACKKPKHTKWAGVQKDEK